MASEKQPSRTSSLRARASVRSSSSSRSPSISRTDYTSNSKTTLGKVTAAALSEKRPILTTVRHSLIVDDGRPLDLVKNGLIPESNISTQESCPAKAIRRSASCSAASRNSMHPGTIQRWGGLTRTVSTWDGLRRDPELWYEDGDCYIHLHGRGASRRGPSFCIPFRVLRQKKCNAIFNQCDAQMTSTAGLSPQPLKRMPSSLSNSNRGSSTVQLFIPAPEATSREDSFNWHITTRNFFAFLLGKPLVGEHMGQAFVDLQERLRLFRPDSNNHQDFLEYAENQGYRDLLECTDYALASVYYAEHYKLREVWIDAFAHCVGMSESLALSPEYLLLSRLTKALITRAHLEVDVHLSRVTTALTQFLEEDLSPAYLGLTPGARSHLDRFRRFLHSFYTEKFGYWPPPRGTSFPKALYKSMYYDFKNLYDYLVDTDSTTDISLQKPASGGICVLQNVVNFDKRHNFTAQPHPLPLLPTYTPPSRKSDSQKALRQLTLASQHNKTHELHTMGAALAVATNSLKQDATTSKIIQAYMRFERVTTNANQREEKLAAVDARKVRWLLIYGTLQYLVSALRAPKEVRDTETADYPLCCLVGKVATPTPTPEVSISSPQVLKDYLSESQCSPCTIQPDCHREDYFSSKPSSRRGSIEVPAPLKIAPPNRASTIRSFVPLSLSARSSRRNSLTLKPTQHCAILVQGYGNGLNETTHTSQSLDSSRRGSSVYSVLPDGAGPETSWLRSVTSSASHSRNPSSTEGSSIPRPRTPLLDSAQLDLTTGIAINRGAAEAPSRSDSTSSSASSSVWSEGGSAASSKSSVDGEHSVYSKASPAEHSGLLGGLVSASSTSIGSPRTRSMTRASIPQSHIHPLLRHPSRHNGFHFGFNNQTSKLTHVSPATDSGNSMIGMALSAPPSPLTRTTSFFLNTQSMDEERPYLPPRAITIDSPPTFTATPSTKEVHDTDVLTTAPSEAWEQYKAALTRQEDRTGSDSCPPSITKTSHNFRVPSFMSSKIGKEEEQGRKKERRLSSLWRR
ncbi:uncharacterized protein K460DRAFT_409313 [Cucurbitaria berberidis CBS 394.84]|uniref:DUF8004 domain-containing protein n=1 Tax=Cucurbitaria berberidis CBS 394.84 TaxID=1168544 RepID=A0A9P4GAJ3_9PLEO|nr:uncharacterized protein K460DRAFT_409313 [Cucurbitaria berberidis CBS 394.84]KAF1841871.1 hypothetical protein K460DRAFT_409313 [Cucurbitaria berberidis CBS 394.84]